MTLAAAQTQPAKEATETEQKPAASEADIRETLMASLRARREEREAPGKGDKPKVKAAESATTPEGDSKAEKTEGEGEEEAPEAEETEAAKQKREFRAQKRQFSKFVAKKEREFAAKEQEVSQKEAHINELLALAERDPVAFVKKGGKDLRELLLRFAEEDNKDPTLKRVEQAEREARAAREEAEKLRKEQEQKAATEQGRAELHRHLASEFSAAKDRYPLLLQHSEGPAEVARYAAQEMIDHYQKTGRELDPEAVFLRLTRNLERFLASKKATEKTSSEPPDQVRTVARREAVNPDGQSKKRRPADVSTSTSRITAETNIGRSSAAALDKRDQTRNRLIEKLRERRSNG